MSIPLSSRKIATVHATAHLLSLPPPSPTLPLCFVSFLPVPLSSPPPKPKIRVSQRAFCFKDKCLDVEIALGFRFESAFFTSYFASFSASNFPVYVPSPSDWASRRSFCLKDTHKYSTIATAHGFPIRLFTAALKKVMVKNHK